MRTATVTFEGISPYSQSRAHFTPKINDREPAEEYEKRTWLERMIFDEKGNAFIPPMAFKNCIAQAAKYLKVGVPGEGKGTYTKYFEAGVLVTEPVLIGVKRNEVKHEWLFVPSDGKRGGGTRVKKCFPIVHEWGGVVNFLVLEEKITKDVFKRHIEGAGSFVGVGRFRPANNGYYGRFQVKKIEWSE